jgi:hypothetical protein
MAARRLQSGGPAKNVLTRDARSGLDGSQCRFTFRERAGLVKRDDGHGVRDLERFGVLDENAVPRGDARADHDGRRRRKPQRAGTGDDQYRHGIDERLLPVAGDAEPAEEGD